MCIDELGNLKSILENCGIMLCFSYTNQSDIKEERISTFIEFAEIIMLTLQIAYIAIECIS